MVIIHTIVADGEHSGGSPGNPTPVEHPPPFTKSQLSYNRQRHLADMRYDNKITFLINTFEINHYA
ncbi:hypothetical protein W822_05125 [Advenella kashmirensis W13003]|uniref:Uncharacterized protein n=1 Tax=Advenella kashmirensis W13003 TaxID=1424334 RepID=V8R0E5_9BURK|nr:hypothetical protein W822_05125 [Advenella kashmirensis W13003]